MGEIEQSKHQAHLFQGGIFTIIGKTGFSVFSFLMLQLLLGDVSVSGW